MTNQTVTPAVDRFAAHMENLCPSQNTERFDVEVNTETEDTVVVITVEDENPRALEGASKFAQGAAAGIIGFRPQSFYSPEMVTVEVFADDIPENF